MKYIKLFEDLNWENVELSEDEFYDEVGDRHELINPQEFTDREIELIEREVKRPNVKIINRKYYVDKFGKKKVLKGGNQLDILVDCEWINQSSTVVLKLNKDTAKEISIWKDEDEWFYVTLRTIIHSNRKSQEKTTYYKCDQLEGLIQKLLQII